MPTVHVLVIDGSHAARYRLRIALRHAGAEVTSVASIEEALPLLHHPNGPARPDLIFANRILPGMNGLELIDLLALDPVTATLPVVITGAGANWPLRCLALERGALAVLPGDADAAALAAVLAPARRGGPARATSVLPTNLVAAMHTPFITPSPPPLRRSDPGRHLPLGLLLAGTGAALLAMFLNHP